MQNKLKFAMLGALITLVQACGGGSGDSSSAPPPAAPAPTPASVSAQVAALEQGGTLPNLDRSTSLVGIDANNDGIRDDVAAWIQQQPATPPQKSALNGLAAANQAALTVDVTADAALRGVAARQHAAVKCVIRREARMLGGTDTISALRSLTANTPERAAAYRKYASALDGSVLKSPQGDGCAN